MLARLLTTVDSYKVRGRDWFSARAHGTHAKAWLFALSFSESSFFLIPPDILLVAILMVNAERWMYYAALTTLASVLGALFGYIIGALFFDTVGATLVTFYGLTEEFAFASDLYNDNAFWVVFTAAFTPIPYKIFVLAGGLFKVNLAVFLIASILGRGIRYGVLAYVTYWLGARIADLLFRYFNLITMIVVIAAAFYLIFIHL